MRVDDLVRNEILWTHRIRELTAPASVGDEDQRSRIYTERVQLRIDGNYLSAKQHKGAKIRLQFLGVRVKDPPAGPSNLASVKGRPDRRVATSSEHQECAPMARDLRRLGTPMGCQSSQYPFDTS